MTLLGFKPTVAKLPEVENGCGVGGRGECFFGERLVGRADSGPTGGLPARDALGLEEPS